MTIPGRDKVNVENGQTYILGHAVKLHSRYMGWDLYRVWDGGKPRMHYIAVNVTSSSGLVTIEARNLDGIKERVRKQGGFRMTKFVVSGVEVELVSDDAAISIIQTHLPFGLFICPDGDGFTAIDNSDGNAWTEWFQTRDIALAWVINEALEPSVAREIEEAISSIKVVE